MAFDPRHHGRTLALLVGGFLLAWWLPSDSPRLVNALHEGLALVRWYAREHVLLCVLPALWIAGGIGVFVSQGAVMRYLGVGAGLVTAYAVASVSGSVLAVCSCTILPLFAGIYARGAGLGPAAAFLYAGPAINALAIILTARILGWELGVARTVGAVGFAVVIGLLMAWIFRDREAARRQAIADKPAVVLPDDDMGNSAWRTIAFFGTMIAILVAANWARADSQAIEAAVPGGEAGAHASAEVSWWNAIHALKWWITAGLGTLFAIQLWRWHHLPALGLGAIAVGIAVVGLTVPAHPEFAVTVGTIGLGVLCARRTDAAGDWFDATWTFTLQIVPLLLAGVLVAGILLGRPGNEGLIPSTWIASVLGGEGLMPTATASLVGALMYFATLTEIPIIEGLRGSGMGDGPSLALLLAGPALSLPSMLVLAKIMGWKMTLTYCALTAVMATVTGVIFGALV